LDECPKFIQFNPPWCDIPKIAFVEYLGMFSDETIIPGYRIPVMARHAFNPSH
jgi:hypothetical protein